MNKPRKLILHIGAHKTGSSAIQSFLHQSRAELQANRWAFCTPPGRPLNWGFMFSVAPKPGGATFSLSAGAVAKLLAQIDKVQRDIILSIEDLFFLDAPAVAAFAEQIKPRFSETTIVCYLRRQDQMALSHWAQGGKTVQSALIFGGQNTPLPKPTPFVRNYLDYATRLTQWQTAFADAKCITRVYDRDNFPNRDVIADFLAVTGIKLKPTTAPAEVNMAFGATSVRFVYLLRDAGVGQHHIRRMLQANQIPVTNDKILPSRQEAMDFVAAFADGNAKLAAEYAAFSTDFSMYPVESEVRPLDPTFVTTHLLALLNSTLKLLPAKPGAALAKKRPGSGPDPIP